MRLTAIAVLLLLACDGTAITSPTERAPHGVTTTFDELPAPSGYAGFAITWFDPNTSVARGESHLEWDFATDVEMTMELTVRKGTAQIGKKENPWSKSARPLGLLPDDHRIDLTIGTDGFCGHAAEVVTKFGVWTNYTIADVGLKVGEHWADDDSASQDPCSPPPTSPPPPGDEDECGLEGCVTCEATEWGVFYWNGDRWVLIPGSTWIEYECTYSEGGGAQLRLSPDMVAVALIPDRRLGRGGVRSFIQPGHGGDPDVIVLRESTANPQELANVLRSYKAWRSHGSPRFVGSDPVQIGTAAERPPPAWLSAELDRLLTAPQTTVRGLGKAKVIEIPVL